MQRLLLTGGAGFIGSHLTDRLLREGHRVHVVDCLTYASLPGYVEKFISHPGFSFSRTDIREKEGLQSVFREFRPESVFHLAAESHVDRSIENAKDFIATNIIGTYNLLGAFGELPESKSENARFMHISTDEVYGSLSLGDAPFTENSQYLPNSPYSASKAASDHLVRAWAKTYSLPAIITHCSNNYGPHQHAEKFIPVVIRNAIARKPVPIYGTGQNVRDWIHVRDHVDGLVSVFLRGRVGEVYNMGGEHEVSNIELAELICRKLDIMRPLENGTKYQSFLRFVADRKGHDQRYSIDNSHIRSVVGWAPSTSFERGLGETIQWYLEHTT